MEFTPTIETIESKDPPKTESSDSLLMNQEEQRRAMERYLQGIQASLPKIKRKKKTHYKRKKVSPA
jgi:hypothetical protein